MHVAEEWGVAQMQKARCGSNAKSKVWLKYKKQGVAQMQKARCGSNMQSAMHAWLEIKSLIISK